MVARAIPGVWELISPAEALRVRQAGAVSALRVLLGGLESEVTAAAGRPWTRLGPAALARLAEALTPVARACARVVPYPSPIGVPAPGAAGTVA
jgi:hypothetical protein